DRAHGPAADEPPPDRGQVRRAVGEAHVRAAAQRQQRAAGADAAEEPVPPLRVLGGLRVSRLDPEERPVETGPRLLAEELAVQVDADLEARIVRHDLYGSRAAERVTRDADASEVEAACQRRARFQLPEAGQLIQREAAVGGPDVDQMLESR